MDRDGHEDAAGWDVLPPVCAIGAGAGGLRALRDLFADLPGDLGLAYLVLLNLPPEDRERLAGILARCTPMPIAAVSGAVRLRPDRIHLLPPDRRMLIEGDRLSVEPFDEPGGERAPVDTFFRSLAAGRGDGLAVVLSGAVPDGAVGARAIKQGAGIVLVQEVGEAECASMPRAAITSGASDFVLPMAEMADRIARVAAGKAATARGDRAAALPILGRILARLHARTNHDLSGYDQATMLRRVRRRQELADVADLGAYEALVRGSDAEARALFTDLLIPVTAFFRDPAAFAALGETVVPGVVEGRHPTDGVRAWVVGCATGEEAYSVAMLFLEEADRRGVSFPLQVFATDIDVAALATARDGRYPRTIEADVRQERLERFFLAEGMHYRVGKRLRDAVLFAEHSVVRDPPFMRMDMDSCRNVLGMMGPELRRRAVTRMHDALRPDGYLFLGMEDEPDPELFAAVRPGSPIYFARSSAARYPAEVVALPRADRPAPVGDDQGAEAGALDAAWRAAAPASIVVDEDRRVLLLSDTAGRYLRPSGGPFPDELTNLARPELRGGLTVALHRALAEGEPSVTAPRAVEIDGRRLRVAVHARPMPDGAEGAPARALVMFLDGGPLAADEDEDEASDEMRDLREQLRISQGRLALCRSEREAAMRDLREARGEHRSLEEEHRSAKGELEACRAERRSAQEELRAVLGEVGTLRREFDQAQADLDDLALGSGVEALFLDAELRPRRLAPSGPDAATARFLDDLQRDPAWAEVEADAGRVLRGLAPLEREVRLSDGRLAALRMRLHRAPELRIVGVVICLAAAVGR